MDSVSEDRLTRHDPLSEDCVNRPARRVNRISLISKGFHRCEVLAISLASVRVSDSHTQLERLSDDDFGPLDNKKAP